MSSTTTCAWIGWSRRTSCRSTWMTRRDRIELVLLEDRRVGGLLALEDDVEDRVQAVVARQHAPELALRDADRMRLLPAP